MFVEGLFSKDADLSQFRGLRVETSSGDWGVIDGTYGMEGLLKVKFKQGLPKYVRPGMKLFVRLRRFVEKGRKARGKRNHLLQPPAPTSLLANISPKGAAVSTDEPSLPDTQQQEQVPATATAEPEPAPEPETRTSTATVEAVDDDDSDESEDMDGWA
mgnify:CR=1 FL=1